jgi:hypothetical protein
MPKVSALCSAGITRPQRSYGPVRLPSWPPPASDVEAATLAQDGLPRLPEPPFRRAVPTTPADQPGARVDCFPAHAARPKWQEGGIRIVTFEACSGFTRVTAHRIAQPPKATFVARLQPGQLPNQAARQLPDQSTTIRVEPSSTDDSRLRSALPIAEVAEVDLLSAVSVLKATSWSLPIPAED